MKACDSSLDFSIDKSAWVNERYIAETDLDLQVEEIQRNGFTILENRLNDHDIQYATQKLDEIYTLQAEDMGGEDNLLVIGEQGLARNLLEYDPFFLKLIRHPDILALLTHFLRDYYTLFQFNGNLNIPDLPATSTPWHRDLTFRHFTTSRPLSMTAIWVLDEFTEESGGISYLAGSHRHDVFPSFEYAEKFQQTLLADAGSVIVLDGLFFHRSGINLSHGRRRICQGMYALPFMLQQISIPHTINGEYKDDPTLKQLLGYNSIQQPSVLEWRQEKLKSKRKTLNKDMIERSESTSE